MKKLGVFKDWFCPVIVSLSLSALSIFLFDCTVDKDQILDFAKLVIPIEFTYATTMLGLSLACYTLFQTLDNDRIKQIRKKKVLYKRFKYYIWHIIILLAILALFSLFELFVIKRLIITLKSWFVLGVPLFLSILTLSALVYWVGLFIKYFDAEE